MDYNQNSVCYKNASLTLKSLNTYNLSNLTVTFQYLCKLTETEAFVANFLFHGVNLIRMNYNVVFWFVIL